ncbi:unnamed protein product [Diatraea saccharalis]|uniref:Uncharacterized protein n=1 Tax=Diatraea saccharalis TaxID=40085 RepID=A0A9N9R0W8_9NEOP|nr:unnamed protein product [Diatraea saccharalis]
MRKRTADLIEQNTPPSSPVPSTTSSFSRVNAGKATADRNKRAMKRENLNLKAKVLQMNQKLKKYRMRIKRLKAKQRKQVANGTNSVRSETRAQKQDIKQAVHEFILQDEYSRLTSGKNETITRKKIKKQIRLLNDTLLNLHTVFKNKTGLHISYQTFRRYRPFWVLFPKASSRNTCLCILHENSDHIVRALQKAKVISFGSASDLAKSICCQNSLNLKCLERTCTTCQNEEIKLNTLIKDGYITYERWVTKNNKIIVKGMEKVCKRSVKENVKTTVTSLVHLLHINLPVYMKHVGNFVHQVRSIHALKEKLSPSEGLLHIDFSENYNCKYSAEIQSAHFGGSKIQLSLHTCVYYSNNSQPPDRHLKTTSLCTVSENLRHDPILICAHLKPVMQRIKQISPDIIKLHVLSDGPSTQYRNKSMFYLIANYVSKELDVEAVIWHFSEKGQGKGAPDGVGGCVKRLCDNSVAIGKDVSNYDGLMTCLQANCKGIEIFGIDDSDVPKIQKILEKSTTKPFKGTFKIHQLTWSRRDPFIIHARRLSCLDCPEDKNCSHFEIGQIHIQYDTSNIYTPELPRSPAAASARSSASPINIATPDGSTDTISTNRSFSPESPPATPDNFMLQNPPVCPKKKNRSVSDNSDSSDYIFDPPLAKKPRRFILPETDSEIESTF